MEEGVCSGSARLAESLALLRPGLSGMVERHGESGCE